MLAAPQTPDDPHTETLTDLIDRMDRESFRRSLEQRDLRVLDARMESFVTAVDPARP